MREEFIHTIRNVVGCLILSGSVAGCVKDNLNACVAPETGTDTPVSFISLHFAFSQNPSTRSNPTGGEQGDGNETGQDYENTVSNATLFFYPSNGGGVNGADVPFAATCYVEKITSPTVGPLEMNGLEVNGTYRVLVVANAGDLRTYATLDDLRNATIDPICQYADGRYCDFVMASENDGAQCELTIQEGNSFTNPATATVELERLAARVDYQAPGSYTLENDTRTATFTRAMLVNLYNQPTYILKRVADDVNGAGLSYLGDETTDNYVLDPKTSSKTMQAAAETAAWYNRYFPDMTDVVDDEGKTVWEDWLAEGDEITNPDDNTDKWLRIGYARENTSSVDVQRENYSTGVVFEAMYGNLGADFTDGATFFRVNKKVLYPTLEAAMKAHDADFDESKTFSDYAVLSAYVNLLDGGDPAGYADYLRTATEDESGYEKYRWNDFKRDILGYGGADNTEATARTRQVLHERTGHMTETYLNGRGYYTYWIRHNRGEGDASVTGLPMEYAVVRNNIYKLIVKSVSGIGSDTPYYNSPEISIDVVLDDSWDVVYDMVVE